MCTERVKNAKKMKFSEQTPDSSHLITFYPRRVMVGRERDSTVTTKHNANVTAQCIPLADRKKSSTQASGSLGSVAQNVGR